eukprot:scaffold3592_cov17-Tisochrysis_lutea.AAC.1
MHDLLTHVMSIVCAPLRSWQDWLRDSNMTIYGHPPTFDFDWERMNAEDLPLPQSGLGRVMVEASKPSKFHPEAHICVTARCSAFMSQQNQRIYVTARRSALTSQSRHE